MANVKPILDFYNTSLSDQFNRLVDPVKQLSLDAVFYSFVDEEGAFFQVGNLPGVGECYFSNGLYTHNCFLCHPDNYSDNQAIIAQQFPDANYHNAQKIVDEKHGVDNILYIYKKVGNSMHCLKFASTNKSVPLNSIFLNNLSLLKSFSDFIIKQWQPNHLKMNNHMINIADDMGPKFFLKNDLFLGLNNKTPQRKIIDTMGLFEGVQIDMLSDREIDCIEHLLMGKNAAQIAQALEISPRTVEFYVSEMKFKLNCSKKAELFQKLQTFKQYNLF